MLGPFQSTACIVAITILIVALIYVAIMLILQSNNDKFPPYSSSCPDYWNMVKQNGVDMCINDKSLGEVSNQGCGQLDPNNSLFSSGSGDCNKYTYAKTCNITWDGITNSEELRQNC